MQNKNNIRRISAGFFLLLFSFCITPKRFLHDLLANHKDAQIVSQTTAQIASSGFHCHADDLVVVAPFIPEIQTCPIPILSSGVFEFKTPLTSFKFVYRAHSDSRGPPAFTIS